eukprot:scaffold112665_cov69-Phaeocystis_antarctica.AAC.1
MIRAANLTIARERLAVPIGEVVIRAAGGARKPLFGVQPVCTRDINQGLQCSLDHRIVAVFLRATDVLTVGRIDIEGIVLERVASHREAVAWRCGHAAAGVPALRAVAAAAARAGRRRPAAVAHCGPSFRAASALLLARSCTPPAPRAARTRVPHTCRIG